MQVHAPSRVPKRPLQPVNESGPTVSDELAGELDRLRRDEQQKVDSAQAEALARIRELARYD